LVSEIMARRYCRLIAAAFAIAAISADRVRAADGAGEFRLAVFEADVTIPLGHPIIAGTRMPAREIVDPLTARGFVLLGGDRPVVVVSVEWCEIRNDAYDRWREVLAEAAGTDRQHVLVSATHVHDAPVMDLTAQQLLEEHHAEGRICDPKFHEAAVQRTAHALRRCLENARRITHVGAGQAKVNKIASNRRFELANGRLSFDRTSTTTDPQGKLAHEGTTDPWLKTLSFWDREQPVLALHAFAVHPQSHWGNGGVSDDFVGQARRRRQADDDRVFQIYASGCSGNLTVGKYNDGSIENRPILAGRLYDAMLAAWKTTRRTELAQIDFRCGELHFEPRSDPGFAPAELRRTIEIGGPTPGNARDQTFSKTFAAMGLSWRQRADAGKTIDLPVIDFGPAKLLLMPAESFVEYQLFAQRICPVEFVVVMGYGDCATGYIPTDRAVEEHDPNLELWRWIEVPCERKVQQAIAEAMQDKDD
jgi:hypothetical protein